MSQQENQSQGTATEGTGEKQQDNTVSNSAIRESNIFRSQAAETTRLKQELDALRSSIDDTKKADELKALEDEKSYKEALTKLTNDFSEKLNSKEAEMSKLVAQIEHKEITQKLLMNGASSTTASDFLATQYKALEGDDKPDLETWINTIKEDSEYLSFFKGAETKPQNNPDTGGAASRKGGTAALDPNASSADMLKAALALFNK